MSENNQNDTNNAVNSSRRKFLKNSMAAAAAFTIVPRHILGGAGYQAASDMVNVAGIGVGARGAQDISGFADNEAPYEREGWGGQVQTVEVPENPQRIANIYALCDVDTEKAQFMFDAYPRAKTYMDWREMLQREPEIDAVMIATPDHNHAPIAAAAMKMGKHVYVEKPMARTVYETRELRRIAEETGVVTQMGNQGRATEGTRLTVEWIRSGAIGPVREVRLSTNRPIWPQGDLERPAGVPVPDTLDWDVWLGPAPEKAYHPDICHFNWRGLWDYGTGAMGDMGAHIFDAPIWALDLPLPTKIQATSTPYNDEFLPQGEILTYEFPARGDMPPLTVSWVDGGLRPPRPDALEDGRRIEDAVYIGDDGVMMHGSHGAVPRLVPETAMGSFSPPEQWIPRTGNIYENFIDSIKNGTKATSDFSVAGHLTEIMLLGGVVAVLSQDQNTTLEYDGENMEITNLPEANDLLHYEYRDGWSLDMLT